MIIITNLPGPGVWLPKYISSLKLLSVKQLIPYKVPSFFNKKDFSGFAANLGSKFPLINLGKSEILFTYCPGPGN